MRWLDEFRVNRTDGSLLRVVVQDGSEGADTGLVMVPLTLATTTVYMQPVPTDTERWQVTMEPQLEIDNFSSTELKGLADELAVAAELCAFLEEKSKTHLEDVAG